jgi:hypothetical protein
VSSHKNAELTWRRRHPVMARALLFVACVALVGLGLAIAYVGGWQR